MNADLTLRDVSLSFTNSIRNAIIANGHTLTLENVTCSSPGLSVNLFCGRLIPSSFETFPLPAPGTGGKIVISGSTNLQGSADVGENGIYAGNLCMGGMDANHNGPDDNGEPNVFSGNPTIEILGGSPQTLGNIYACGAQQRIPVGALGGKNTYPDSEHYTVAGTVRVSGKLPCVIGAGASAVEAVYLSDNQYLAEQTMTGLSSLHVEKGNLALTQGSSFRGPGADLSISGGAILNLADLTAGVEDGVLTIGSLSGDGSLALGQSQTLSITGAVTGTTSIGIGGIFNGASSSSPIQGHTYIRAPSPPSPPSPFCPTTLIPTWR